MSILLKMQQKGMEGTSLFIDTNNIIMIIVHRTHQFYNTNKLKKFT